MASPMPSRNLTQNSDENESGKRSKLYLLEMLNFMNSIYISHLTSRDSNILD